MLYSTAKLLESCRRDTEVNLVNQAYDVFFSGEVAKALMENESLELFVLSDDTYLGGAEWEIICKVLVAKPKLAELRIRDRVRVNLGRLVDCRNVKRLCLANIETEGLAELVERLPNLKQVTLDTNLDMLDQTGLMGVGHAMQLSKSISRLILEDLSPNLTRAALIALVTSNLKHLDLATCSLEAEGVQSLIRVLAIKAPALTRLAIQHAEFDHECTVVFSKQLHGLKSLKKVTFNNNNMRDAEMALVCGALVGHPRLCWLELGKFRIPSRLPKELADLVRRSTTLVDFDISQFDPQEAEEHKLLDALSVNKSIRALDINGSKRFIKNLWKCNGWILDLYSHNFQDECDAYNTRNRQAHERARTAAYSFMLCSRRMPHLHKDLVKVIAKMVLDTKGQVEVWWW